MSKILGIVQACKECPHRHYYSGGVYECTKVGQNLPRDVEIPEWCPLPNHPAHEMERMREIIKEFRAGPTVGDGLP